MTQRQKKLAMVWLLVVVFVSAFAVAGYAILSRGGDSGAVVNESVVPIKTLSDVISSRKSWDVDFRSWAGKAVGELVVTDLGGKSHNLSDYKGKNVLVVFWATWCPACNMEIPHLIDLREKYGVDKLQILAISNESESVLKPFVKAKNINYMVATPGESLSAPFNMVSGIPTTFFIDSEGKLKLAAIGLVSLEDSVAILNATE